MRVLGIDPGSRFMGYGVVEERRGRLLHVGHGVIKGDPDAALELRLKVMHEALLHAFKLHRPDAVAVEGVFTFRNARSALILGHARGVALLAAAQVGLSVHEYAPAKVKRSVGAGGAADKDAVARMVCTFLGLEELERSDVSDALAVALCHLNHSRMGVPVSGVRGRATTRARATKAQLADKLTPSYRRPEAG